LATHSNLLLAHRVLLLNSEEAVALITIDQTFDGDVGIAVPTYVVPWSISFLVLPSERHLASLVPCILVQTLYLHFDLFRSQALNLALQKVNFLEGLSSLAVEMLDFRFHFLNHLVLLEDTFIRLCYLLVQQLYLGP
jgi:hypothetical protein